MTIQSKTNINIGKILFLVVIVIYTLNICGILFTVILNSVSREWYSGVLPTIYTTEWYTYIAGEHDIPNLLFVTFIVSFFVVVISLLIAFPTAYALARYKFRLRGLLMTLLLLPMIIPPMAYGIPLATTL